MAAVVGLLIWLGSGDGDRDSRLSRIDRTRSLASKVAPHHSSPIVRAISEATGTDVVDYLQRKIRDQEHAASKFGDLVCLSVWAPELSTQKGWQDFLLRSSTNSARSVGWSLSEDEVMTGYVRPEDLGIWQSELCTITNSVPWADLQLFKSAREGADWRLPDGSLVSMNAFGQWLDSSIADGWSVGVSIVHSNNDVVVATRKRLEVETESGPAPNAPSLHR